MATACGIDASPQRPLLRGDSAVVDRRYSCADTAAATKIDHRLRLAFFRQGGGSSGAIYAPINRNNVSLEFA